MIDIRDLEKLAEEISVEIRNVRKSYIDCDSEFETEKHIAFHKCFSDKENNSECIKKEIIDFIKNNTKKNVCFIVLPVFYPIITFTPIYSINFMINGCSIMAAYGKQPNGICGYIINFAFARE